jgi:trehalose/maltose transport system substrate-binding protein
MRNWTYAVALSSADDSAVKGLFDIAPLPAGDGGAAAATLGGWNLALSKYTRHRSEAVALIKFLTAADAQKYRALKAANLPTMPVLYDDADIAAEQPWMKRWQSILEAATPRPSAITGRKYNEVSQAFWNAAHETLEGRGTGAENLSALRTQLERIKGSEW